MWHLNKSHMLRSSPPHSLGPEYVFCKTFLFCANADGVPWHKPLVYSPTTEALHVQNPLLYNALECCLYTSTEKQSTKVEIPTWHHKQFLILRLFEHTRQ